MAGRKSRPPQVVDLAAVLPSLRERIEQQGFLRKTELSKAGVPKPQHQEALERLVAETFEPTKTGVRVPLRAQMSTLLSEGRVIALGQLAKSLKGCTQKEAKAVAETLAAEGAAKVAIRGKVEVLVPASLPTLSHDQLLQLAAVGALAAKAARKGQRTLTLEDVRERVLDLVAAPRGRSLAAAADPPAARADQTAPEGAAPVEASNGSVTPALVLAELRRHVRASVGLAFVPDAVRVLAALGVPAVQATLLDAARAGLVELQPESGVGRLTEEELALCPPGPQGTRLSWARLLGGDR